MRYSLRHVQLFVTLWMVAHHAPLSMRFSRQEYWSGLPFPSPGDLSDPGMEPRSPASWVDSLPSEPPGKAFLGVVEIKRPDRRKNQVYVTQRQRAKLGTWLSWLLAFLLSG